MIIFINSISATAYVATFAVFGNQQHSHDDHITNVRIFARVLPRVGVLHYSPDQSSLCHVCMLGSISDVMKDLMNEKN